MLTFTQNKMRIHQSFLSTEKYGFKNQCDFSSQNKQKNKDGNRVAVDVIQVRSDSDSDQYDRIVAIRL